MSRCNGSAIWRVWLSWGDHVVLCTARVFIIISSVACYKWCQNLIKMFDVWSRLQSIAVKQCCQLMQCLCIDMLLTNVYFSLLYVLHYTEFHSSLRGRLQWVKVKPKNDYVNDCELLVDALQCNVLLVAVVIYASVLSQFFGYNDYLLFLIA